LHALVQAGNEILKVLVDVRQFLRVVGSVFVVGFPVFRNL
jgi:hypothetical protein